MKALVIEDSPEITDSVRLCVSMRWPEATVVSSSSGISALAMARREDPNIVILDLGLPDMDGLEVLERLREGSDVPVIIVTARGDETARVKGLEMGADDYLVKPFSHTELMARMNAILRRGDRPIIRGQSGVFKGNGITVDLPGHRLQIAGEQVNLTPTEWALLGCLANADGRVVTHEDLAHQVWGSEYLDHSAIKMCVRRLRQKLGEDATSRQIVRSHRGIGYSLDLGSG